MSVTAQLTNFEATSDFSVPDFFPDDCGETAFSVIEHVKDNMTLTGDAIAQVRFQMSALGLPVKGGTTMGELVAFFRDHRGLPAVYVNDYGSSWDAIHATLLEHAGRDGVVIEVEHASRLANNEADVNRHFVAIGAIHPVRGYLIANGDTLASLNAAGGHGKIVPCYWMDRDQLALAVPSACAIVTGLAHTETLSPAVMALPQARIVEGSLVLDDAPATSQEPQGGNDGTQETAGSAVPAQEPAAVEQSAPTTQEATPEVAPAPNLPRFLDQGNIDALRGAFQEMRATVAQHLTLIDRLISSLPL